MKKNTTTSLYTALFAVIFVCINVTFAQTNPTAKTLATSQNFGTTTFTAIPTGFAVWTVNSSPVGSQTNAQNSTTNGDATITAATATQTTGGAYGYATFSNARVYFQTSSNSTNGTNQLACAINTTGWTSVLINYDIEAISMNPRTIGAVLQYRIGTSGSWTTISGTTYSHTSIDRSNGAIDNFTNIALPSGANNNAIVQLRWAIWRGSETGNSSGIAIDNISITATSSQTSYYFRSKQSGNFNDLNSWEASADNSAWNNATVTPTSTANTITILNGHHITLTASETIDQTVIDAGGILTYATGSASIPTISNGAGTDLIINGTFEDIGDNPIVWSSGAKWSIGNNATLLRTRSTSANNWRDNYDGGISTITATANWILRKTSSDNPSLSSTGNMYYPNLIIENTTGSTWSTSTTPGFTGTSNAPVIKGDFNIGGNSLGNLSFINDNNATAAVLVGGNLSIKAGSTLRNYGTGLEVQGNITLNGTIEYGTNTPKLVFSGSNNQTVTGAFTFKNVELNKTSGSATVTLNSPATVTGTFTFTSGKLITTATNLLTFNNGATVTGASNNSYIDGPCKKVGNAAFTFPTGKNGNYQPIGITAPSNSTDAFTGEYFNTGQTLGAAHDTTINNISTCEYWQLNRTTGISTVNIKLGWNANSCNVIHPVNMAIAGWSGSIWKDLGSGLPSGRSTIGNITNAVTVNTFGAFTLTQKAVQWTLPPHVRVTGPDGIPGGYTNISGAILATVCLGTTLKFEAEIQDGADPAAVWANVYWDVLNGTDCSVLNLLPLMVPYTLQPGGAECRYTSIGMHKVHCYIETTGTSPAYEYSETFYVNVIDNFINPSFNASTIGCSNTSVCFENTTVGNETNGIWDFGDLTGWSVQNYLSTSACHVYSQPGTYNVTLKVIQGDCEEEISQQVIVQPIQLTFSAPSVCVGLPSDFIANTICNFNTTDFEWVWNFGDGYNYGYGINPANYGITSGTFDHPIHTYANAGTYQVTLIVTSSGSFSNYSSTTYSYNVTVYPLPIASVPANIVVCNGGSISPIVFNSNPVGATYNWVNSNPNSTIGIGSSGSGNIAGFNAINNTNSTIVETIAVTPSLNGCEGVAKTFTITVNPTITPSVSITQTSGSNPTCLGSSVTFTATPSNGGTTPSYQWQVDGVNAGTNSATFTILNPTIVNDVTCILTPNASCLSSSPATSNVITLNVTALPIVNVTPTSATICLGESATLPASGADTYTWSNGASGNQINVSPLITTTYLVIGASNLTGCTTTTTATVAVNPLPDPTTISGSLNVCIGTEGKYVIDLYDPITYDYTFNFSPIYSGAEGTIASNNTFPITWNASGSVYITITDKTTGCSNVTNTLIVNAANCCEGPPINEPAFNTTMTTSISNANFSVINDIVILSDVTLTNVTLGIASDINNPITITIWNGATLTLDNCHIYGCVNMWQGFNVKQFGKIELRNGTLIEDAYTAINATYDVAQNTLAFARNIVVDDAIFNRNLTGLEFTDTYSNTASSSVHYSTPFTIKNTVFTCKNFNNAWPTTATLKNLTGTGIDEEYTIGGSLTANLKPNNLGTCPHHDGCHARTGIKINNLGKLNDVFDDEMYIGQGNSVADLNLFDNIAYGIVVNQSSLTCHNNAFQHIRQDGLQIYGTAIVADFHPTMEQSYINGAHINITGDAALGLGKNTFYDCHKATTINDYYDVNVSNNNIRSSQTGIAITSVASNSINVVNNTLSNVGNAVQFFGNDIPFYDSNFDYNQNIASVTINENTIQADLQGNTSNPVTGAVAVGIYMSNLNDNANINGSHNNLTITNNHLYNVATGIIANNWRNLGGFAISDNYIKLMPNPNLDPAYGILSTLNDHAFIIGNNVISNGSNLSENGCAISVQDNNVNTNICSNTVTNTNTGVEFINNPATNTTAFKNNTMVGSGFGFVLDNSIIGQQGAPANGSGNRWAGTYSVGSQFKTYTLNVNTSPPPINDPSQSKLYVYPSGTDYDPEYGGTLFNDNGNQGAASSIYSSSLGSILYSSAASTQNCEQGRSHSNENSLGQQKSMQTINGLDIYLLEQIVMDSIAYSYFETEQRINDKFRVYRMLSMDSTLMDSSLILQSFYLASQNGNIGKLASTEKALAKGLLANATSLLNTVAPANAIENNYKNYYSCYINYKDSSYSSSDSAKLKTLALGCPVRDGIVVYQARSLYSMIYNDFTLYRNNCSDETNSRKYSSSKKTIEKEYGLSLYPNPTSGDIYLAFDKELINKKAMICIFDIAGVLVLKQNITVETLNKINVNLNNGTYFISIKSTDEAIKNYNGKITIIK